MPSTCSSHPTPSVDDGNTQKNRTRAREYAYPAPPLFSLPPTLKRSHGESSPCRQPVPHTPPHPLTMETCKKIGHEHANTHTWPPPLFPLPPPSKRRHGGFSPPPRRPFSTVR